MRQDVLDLVPRWLAGDERVTQVALDETDHVVRVLLPKGFVEPHLLAILLDGFFGRVVAEHGPCRIARDHADHEEDDGNDDDQRRDRQQQTPEDMSEHRRAFPSV